MVGLRAAIESDLPAILAIYNEVIATSTAVYALEPAALTTIGKPIADRDVNQACRPS